MTKTKFKLNLKIFYNLYILSIKSFLYSPLNMFLGVFLILFILIIWLLFKSDDPFIFASAIGTLIARNGVHTFYRNVNMNRTVGFSQRMKFTGMNGFLRPFANILASFTINALILMLMLTIIIIFFKEQRNMFEHVNWTMFLTGAFLLWILSVLISYSIYVFCKNQTWGNIIASLIYLISYNLLGCAFPYETIAGNAPWLNFVLYFVPQRYMMNVMQAGWVDATNLNYLGKNNGQYKVDFKLRENLLIPYLITFSFILILSILLITFIIINVQRRKKDGYGANIVLKLSSKYIRDIKRCTNIEELNNLRSQHLTQLGFDSNYIKNNEGYSNFKNLKHKKGKNR
ncbi:ABC-2 transporter permease [Spiroplasma taiwanense]|uniref:ABC transporter permease protein n=1 Tax=Spiroplasma taiwanense CT-1 TaxID=1276220 RepID=S5M0C7_9MOLU|nr:ABC transporter permease [Spiroplasma taiwanense]AGR41447.1 ABC transporter permease protein [Spiroplasma taiwanense CT-1]